MKHKLIMNNDGIFVSLSTSLSFEMDTGKYVYWKCTSVGLRRVECRVLSPVKSLYIWPEGYDWHVQRVYTPSLSLAPPLNSWHTALLMSLEM